MIRRASEPVRAVLLAAALVAGYLLFREVVTLAVLVVVVLILSLPMAAAADAFERRHLPRVAGAGAALLAGLGLLAGALSLIVPPFVDQAQRFVDEIPQLLEQLRARVGQATDTTPSEVGQRAQDALQGVLDEPMQVLGPIAAIGLGVAGALATLVLVVMTAFYVAVAPRPLVDGLLSLFPARRRDAVRAVLGEIRESWLGWVRAVGLDMLVSGVLLYIGLSLIGVEFALVFAVLSALLVVVPYFGAIAGGLPPVLFALADSFELAGLTLLVYVVVQQVEGNLIVPLIMSRAVSLHPAVIIVGVVVVGRVLGITGLFVAVPLISAVVILTRALWVEPIERDDSAREERMARVASTAREPLRPAG